MVQYVLELGHVEACQAVVASLRGNFSTLSLQKFSSNVVERCLKLGGMDAEREDIVRELAEPVMLPRLLQVRARLRVWGFFWGGGRRGSERCRRNPRPTPRALFVALCSPPVCAYARVPARPPVFFDGAQDAYGNYVVQSALNVSNGPTHNMLVDAIRPYLPTLRGTPHGKRIMQRINGKA